MKHKGNSNNYKNLFRQYALQKGWNLQSTWIGVSLYFAIIDLPNKWRRIMIYIYSNFKW